MLNELVLKCVSMVALLLHPALLRQLRLETYASLEVAAGL